MRISLKDFGGFLSSPELGKRIGVSVLDSIRKEPEVNVIIDFSGVQGVNRHFCEEFLTLVFRGIGFEEFRKKVIMQNQAAVVKMVFDSVINQKKGIEAEGIDKVIGEPIHTVQSEKAQIEKEEKVERESEVRVEEPQRELSVSSQEKPDEVLEEKTLPQSAQKTEEEEAKDISVEAGTSVPERKIRETKPSARKKSPLKKETRKKEFKPKKAEKKPEKKSQKSKPAQKKSAPRKKK